MTLSHVYEMMAGIKPGDKVFFDSYGACDNSSQLGRKPSVTIPATGTVEQVYPRYVVARLKAARECVQWYGIRKVNGTAWPLYRRDGR